MPGSLRQRVQCAPSKPLLVIPKHGVEQVASVPEGGLPVNELSQPITIRSDLFEGRAAILVKGLPGEPHDLFAGKKQRAWFVLQGRFKQRLPLDSLHIGSEFARPLDLPASALLTPLLEMFMATLGAGELRLQGQQPHLYLPLARAAQMVNVALPGREPDMCLAGEDMRLVDAAGGLAAPRTGAPLMASRRQAHFGRTSSWRGLFWDPGHVYTFHLYETMVDYASFKVALPLLPISIAKMLSGQPFQWMIKHRPSGRYALNLEVWHEEVLAHAWHDDQQQDDGGRQRDQG